MLTLTNFVEDLQKDIYEKESTIVEREGEYESVSELQRELVNSLCLLP